MSFDQPNYYHFLDLSNKNLTSLDHLVIPHHIKKINCSGNRLTHLPPLPPNLISLDCSGNMLRELPELPSTLITLNCQDNYLQELPSLEKNTELGTLNCSYNALLKLPSLSENNNLTHLFCSNNAIKELPSLEKNEKLVVLDCNDNYLVELPSLKHIAFLRVLRCGKNPLIKLPSSLNTSLFQISCVGTLITEIPSLKYCTGLYRLNYSLAGDESDVYDEIVNKLDEVKKYQSKLEQFAFLFYSLKLKKQLRDWLWKQREIRAQKDMHPDRIAKLLICLDFNFEDIILELAKKI